MKKSIAIFVVLLIVTLCCNACSDKKESGKKEEGIKYSNLVSDSVQNTLKEIMSESGISNDRQQMFFSHVDQFNATVPPEMLASEFEVLSMTESKYDPYEMQDEWMKKSPDFMGYNCRITAFGLFADYLELPITNEVNDEMILMDLISLEEDSSILLDEDDRSRFVELYSTIPTTLTKDKEIHARNLQENWQKRGIRFLENNKASLITVVFHESFAEDENYLFIGHVGVLFEGEEKIYFVEKIAFQEPYQLTKFDNRAQLNDYLMTKYDIAFDQPTAAPFVMENNQLMEG